MSTNSATAGRLTVVEMIYHQQHGAQPTATENRSTQILNTDEQPYRRICKVDEQWRLLDTGWLQDASLVCVSNEEGKSEMTNPTEDRAEQLDNSVVEVSFDGENPVLLVSRLRSVSFCPVNVNVIWLRCPAGKCKVIINVYPR